MRRVPVRLQLTLAAALLITAGSLPSLAARMPDPQIQENKVNATVPTELVVTDVKKGTGPAIAAGQTAVVHYTGWLYSPDAKDHKGQKFDSSRDRNDPFSFNVGGGEVIGGWDQGVVGMQVGGHRTLVIPPSLGYGARGAGGVIPGNATLLFDIELIKIQ
jgi:FKBP-type peptidyl-prolyl cis-trans isomerase FkpA